MNSHKLAKYLLSAPDKPVTASVDISTCDEDSGRRIFTGLCMGINDLEADEITLLFESEPEDNYGKKL